MSNLKYLALNHFTPYFLIATLVVTPFMWQDSTGTMGNGDELAVTDLVIAQKSGRPEQTTATGDAVTIQSTVTNSESVEKSIAYVVQIKNSSNRVVFISLTTLLVGSEEKRLMETAWSATEGGNHSVQVFAWENVESPTVFSHNITHVQIDPKAGFEKVCMGTASCLQVVVIRIVDGDTIDVSDDIRVRLSLVDTPERGADGYQEATTFTERTCPEGSEVLIDEDDGQTSGSYGRLIAKVYCEGGMINEELLKSQNAIILDEFCEVSEFGRDEWAVEHGC